MKIRNCLQVLLLGLVTLFFQNRSSAVEEQYTIYDLGSVHDKWFGRFDNRIGINDEMLKVGGKDDIYYSMIRMPSYLPVPPRILLIRARLILYSYGSKRPTTMRKYFVKDTWTETSTTDQYTVHLQDLGSIAAPPVNGEYSIDITPEFGTWITGAYGNHGILLAPENTDNKFNNFLSSENTMGYGKPRIVIDYERLPDFKMPLQGDRSWRLTVEAGGKQFDEQSALDTFHTGNTYYSLDFNAEYVPTGGSSFVTAVDAPIYASAGGKVVASEYNSANGWYVKIDHDGDGNVNTGFQTVYIHMKEQPLVSVGKVIPQGKQIGIMGNTGISLGTHLHMTFYYKNAGGSDLDNYDSPYLNALRMEGRAIKNYKLGTTWNSSLGRWTPYFVYPSSNTH